MSELLNQFNKEYNFLYEAEGYVAGYDEAVDWFDQNKNAPGVRDYVHALIEERGDFIASDREAAAFAFACEVLEIGE